MNSTVNYGYETEISAISTIDRDLKRVEGKAESALILKDQIVENEKQILSIRKDVECLSGRVACKDQDQKLEKHKKNPHAHQELLDRKVDKRDGYGLISDAELEQIDRNQQDIAVLDARVTSNEEGIAKTYTQDEVNALLAKQRQEIEGELSNKADKEICVEYEIPMCEGYEAFESYNNRYSKNIFGQVIVSASIRPEAEAGVFQPLQSERVAILPEGFRPSATVQFPALLRTIGTELQAVGICHAMISPDGSIHYRIPKELSSTAFNAMQFSVPFQAKQ